MMNKQQERFESFDYFLSDQIVVCSGYHNEAYNNAVLQKQEVIEYIWEKEQKERTNKLFNGRILNLAVVEEREGALFLQCHHIEYKHYMAQRAGVELGITPLAVSGIVFYTKNNTKIFIVGKRSASVTQYPGYYEFIPSGSVDASDAESGENIKYKKQLFAELREELGLAEDKVKSCKGFCLIFDKQERVYDIGIEVEVEFDQKLIIHESEYSMIQTIPENYIAKYMDRDNVVDASRMLLKAWSGLQQANS